MRNHTEFEWPGWSGALCARCKRVGLNRYTQYCSECEVELLVDHLMKTRPSWLFNPGTKKIEYLPTNWLTLVVEDEE